MVNKKEIILESAIKLFTKRGFHKTTLKDIAQDIGISKGTLFYYYPSKEGLLYDIFDMGFETLVSLIKQMSELNQIGISEQRIEYLYNELLTHDYLMKINFNFVHEAIIGNACIKEKLKLQYEKWRSDVKEVIMEMNNDLTEAQLDVKAAIIIAVIDGIFLQYFMDPSKLNIKDISVELSKMLDTQ